MRLKERELSLILDDQAFNRLVSIGYDPVFGARPLKRAIQSQIENPLAQHLLAGDFEAGDTISVTGHDDGLHFEQAQFH